MGPTAGFNVNMLIRLYNIKKSLYPRKIGL